jgi:arylsulfatase A-like enzyme
VQNPIAAFPGMVIRLDDTVGRIIELLKELGIEKNTIICFTSDNGPAPEGAGRRVDIFNSSGPLRGIKRDLTEGGIRVPFLVQWRAKVKPGTVSDHVSAFWDFLPTICDILGIEPPEGIDGISFLPTLEGKTDAQKIHDYLYWEFHERGGSRALRIGDWKAIQLNVRNNPESPVELYNLKDDIEERNNLAGRHPEKIERFRKMFNEIRVATPDFPFLPGE